MSGVRRVAVVTGTRAEFGLLHPVMREIEAHDGLELLVVAGGAHLLPPGETIREVEASFDVAAVVPMQEAGASGRAADARALGRGVSGFADVFESLSPDWVVVLGDRIEAMAAASAASVGGVRVAHVHAGDRAEGVADEAMRHAITKLAHLHLCATTGSHERVVRMGEDPAHAIVVGSPAIDGLDSMGPLDDDVYRGLGSPRAVVLMHPVGRGEGDEFDAASAVLGAVCAEYGDACVALSPNFDPGRDGVVRAIGGSGVRLVEHLERRAFVGLLRRVEVLVGNSSAGLIEACALGCRVVDVGSRQGGRERGGNVVSCEGGSARAVREAIVAARGLEWDGHPYGNGRAGVRIAGAVAGCEVGVRKRCWF